MTDVGWIIDTEMLDIAVVSRQHHYTALLGGIKIGLDETAKKMIAELKEYLNAEPEYIEDISVCHFCKKIVRTDEIVIQEGGESYCSVECRDEDNE